MPADSAACGQHVKPGCMHLMSSRMIREIWAAVKIHIYLTTRLSKPCVVQQQQQCNLYRHHLLTSLRAVWCLKSRSSSCVQMGLPSSSQAELGSQAWFRV